MENWLFRLSMPYHVIMEKNKIIVQNRKYYALFEGHFKLPLSTKMYEHIANDIAYKPDERFAMDCGEFWLYDDGSIPLTERDINHTMLTQYYKRLTLLLELCEGVHYTDNNPLMGLDPKDAQIKELLESVKNLTAAVARQSGSNV